MDSSTGAGEIVVEAAPQASRAPLPTDPAAFDADERIAFSKLSDKFILEAEDGQEFEWEHALKRWVPVLDDSLLEQQRQAYAVQGVDEAEPATQSRKKRKKDDNEPHDDRDGLVRKQRKSNKEPRERKNTAVYVTNLPFDATADEVNSVFSKCGMVAESMESKEPRIKLYTDDQGRFKGDGLVVYFRAESVDLAVQMLDDTDFRLGANSGPAGRMRVAPADFSYKSQKEAPPKQSDQEKQKIIKKTQKLNSKLADWDDDDPQTLQPAATKWDKVVVLKHMFTLAELRANPAAALDIKEDIRDECGKLGAVTNVVLYDEEPDGVVMVRFQDPVSAQTCVRAMNGRFFDGTRVEAYVPEGKVRFRKSGKHDDEGDEDLGSTAAPPPVTAAGTADAGDAGSKNGHD